MAITKKTAKKAVTKQKAEAFINWNVLDKTGEITGIKGSQALYRNDYTSAGENWLLDQLDLRDGEEFEITLKATVRTSGKATLEISATGII